MKRIQVLNVSELRLSTMASEGRSGGESGESSGGDGGEWRNGGDDSEGRAGSVNGEERAGGGHGLHVCHSCGEDTGSTTALFRHVEFRCLAMLGESMNEFRRKFRAERDRVRYRQQIVERRARARAREKVKVS